MPLQEPPHSRLHIQCCIEVRHAILWDVCCILGWQAGVQHPPDLLLLIFGHCDAGNAPCQGMHGLQKVDLHNQQQVKYKLAATVMALAKRWSLALPGVAKS